MSKEKYRICPFCGTEMTEVETPMSKVIENFTCAEHFDWQTFRAEAAKDILCAFISNERIKVSKDNTEDFIECSIALADVLTIKLKGDGKE